MGSSKSFEYIKYPARIPGTSSSKYSLCISSFLSLSERASLIASKIIFRDSVGTSSLKG